MKQHTIALLGSINMDLAVMIPHIPQIDEVVYSEEFKMNLGGKASNTAVAFARLGSKPYMLGCIGTDAFATEVSKVFESEKVSLKYVNQITDTPTGSVIVGTDQNGKNTIIVNSDANYKITEKDLDKLFRDIDAGTLSIDLLYVTLETQDKIFTYAITEGNKRNIPIFCDAAPFPTQALAPLLEKVDFIAPNMTEAKLLTGIEIKTVEDAYKAAHKISEMGAKNVIITMSELGAVFLHTGDKPIYFPAQKINPVDETATGDAFRAAFCVRYLDSHNIDSAMNYAIEAGAFATTKFGAYDSMPRITDLES